MAEKIVSPGVFTKEVDQSFLPAAISEIGALVIGPTNKGPFKIPTVVNTYNEYEAIFGSQFKSGSGYYRFLTDHTAENYLKNGSSLTVVRIPGQTQFGPASSSAGRLRLTTNATIDQYDMSGSQGAATDFPGHPLPSENSQLSDISRSFAITTLSDGKVMANANSGSWMGLGDSEFRLGTAWSDEYGVSKTAGNGIPHSGPGGILNSGSRDNVRWNIPQVNVAKGSFTLQVRRGDDIHKRQNILETWNNVNLDPNSPNFIEKVIGNQSFSIGTDGATKYIKVSGDYPNKSKYIRVSVPATSLTPDYLDENGNIRKNEHSCSLPTVQSGAFFGGVGGDFGVLSGDYSHPMKFYDNITAGNNQGIAMATTAITDHYVDVLNILSNQDEYDFNLIMTPGIASRETGHTIVATKAIEVCEERGDAFYVVDPTLYGSTVSTAKSQAETRDSNYAAMYWPWVQVPDNKLGKAVWVPPSVVMPSVYAFNDKVAAPWFAPAGLNRGGIETAIQAERKLTHGNRDDLYESNVNPIATFPAQGVCAWGQKTLQKKASALDRINVRRLLIKVKKFIASSSRFLVFEQNNNATRKRFLNIVNPYLEQVQSQSGLSAFRVVMDDSNNTPDTIDRNILYGQIFLQPTRTAEFIVLDFTVQPTGATFPE